MNNTDYKARLDLHNKAIDLLSIKQYQALKLKGFWIFNIQDSELLKVTTNKEFYKLINTARGL